MPTRFWELSLPTWPETAEALTNFLWDRGALGVVEEDVVPAWPGAPLPSRLRAFFPETASPATLAASARDYCSALAALGFSVASSEPTVTPLLDGAWAEAWRESFRPRPIGRRLLVVPPWDIPADMNRRRAVIIEPGRAFGTGTHGSTLGCLVLLESFLERSPADHALDVGTGTGILAIAALVLGVSRVTAVDTDPDAIGAAISNAGRNGVVDRIRCLVAGPETLDGETFPLILANLLAGSHLSHASLYRRMLAMSGALIVGGILPEEEASVANGLGALGLTQLDRVEIEAWVSLLMTTNA